MNRIEAKLKLDFGDDMVSYIPISNELARKAIEEFLRPLKEMLEASQRGE